MLYVTVTRNEDGKIQSAQVAGEERDRTATECRWNWKTFEEAQEVAQALGSAYVACDAGANVSPRYDVRELPRVGDKVSYAFNGDSYPCGVIKSISKSLKLIVTDRGDKFYRVRQTGSWRKDGTWSLVAGHVSERNPEF